MPLDCKIRTARKDKTVFKSMSYQKKGHYLSMHKQFRYADGFHYSEIDNFPVKTYLNSILKEEGFHAYLDIADVSHNVVDSAPYHGKYIAVECTIPKGAKYILGTNETVICSDLIVIGMITRKRYCRLIEKKKNRKELKELV